MGRLLLGSVLTGALLGIALEATAQEKEVKQQTAPEKTTSELTLEEIAEEVKKPVEEILKGVPITYLTPDNYEQEVYQAGLLKEQKKPVIVLFYGSFVPEGAKATDREGGPSKRLAIVIRELAKKYTGIKFCVFDDAKYANPVLSGLAKKEGVTGIPSLAMYSPFDLVKGETPEKNDGRIEKIDILSGGPKTEKGLASWIAGCDVRWISTNITNLNGEYVERFNNSGYVSKLKIN